MTARTRTREDLSPVNQKVVDTKCSYATTEYPVTGNYVGEIETTTDVVTPNFFVRKAKGDIINNPFHSLKQEYGYFAQNYSYTKSGTCTPSTALRKQEGFNHFPYVSDRNKDQVPTDALSALVWSDEGNFNDEVAQQANLVGTRAAAGIVPAEVQGLVELAEFTKTLRLVRHPVDNLKAYIKRLRKSKKYKRSRAKDLGTYLANDWLSLRYGFTPLVLLIDEGLKAVTTERRSKRQTARSSTTVAPYTQNTNHGVYNGWSYGVTTTSTITAEATVRAGILYDHTFSLEDKYGYAAHDILSTAWELFPYSFVVDWMVNMQDYIRANTPKAGVRHLADWTTVEKTVTRRKDYAYHWNSPAGHTNTAMPGGYMYRTDRDKVRNPGVNTSLTSKLQTIRFEAPKDWLHLADGISLIIGSLNYR